MKIFGISDLHLSFKRKYDPTNPPPLTKPMDIFGSQWDNYPVRIRKNWLDTVSSDDTVLIPGDISWAMNLQEACYDLDFIGDLPGKKIICRGNHDYWWDGVGKVRNALPAGISALQHDALDIGGFAVCATRGWLLPGHNDFKENTDRKIYDRELLRLGFALEAAAKYGKPIILMLHYPPVDEAGHESDFTRIIREYNVSYCVYGHIHGSAAEAFKGEINGTSFYNVSADKLECRPLLICENAG